MVYAWHDTIQNNLILRIYFATRVMFYVVNFSQVGCKVDHLFPILARGLFLKIAGKSPAFQLDIHCLLK